VSSFGELSKIVLTFYCLPRFNQGYDSLLHIYDINARSNLESIQVNCAHRDEGIWSVAWSTTKGRNGRGLGVGGGDGIVRVYEV
jgi:WD40 repeat protein